jgi:hypothetical protein
MSITAKKGTIMAGRIVARTGFRMMPTVSTTLTKNCRTVFPVTASRPVFQMAFPAICEFFASGFASVLLASRFL